MLIESGRTHHIDEVLHHILQALKKEIKKLKAGKKSKIKEEYQQALFRMNKPSTFKDREGHLFSGYIKGVTNSGHLKILVEDDQIREFQLKEVELMY